MSHSKSSQNWLNEHFSDQYVKKAQKGGYRARSAFKLIDVQKKDNIIRPGMTVIDLGSAPGGWSQVVVELLKGKGQVLAVDILPMEKIEGVDFIQGDFQEENTFKILLSKLNNQKIDLVLSDMAPNVSGIKFKDQAEMIYLAELALELAEQVLKPGGSFLVKIFQGEGFQEYLKLVKEKFRKVSVRKPQASRNRSGEVYLLAKGFNH